MNHQTRYELHDDAGLACILTYTAEPDEPAAWKILLPGPGGTEDLYASSGDPNRTPAGSRPAEPIIGSDRAAELTAAVDAAPPPAAAWKQHDTTVTDRAVPPSRRHEASAAGICGLTSDAAGQRCRRRRSPG